MDATDGTVGRRGWEQAGVVVSANNGKNSWETDTCICFHSLLSQSNLERDSQRWEVLEEVEGKLGRTNAATRAVEIVGAPSM